MAFAIGSLSIFRPCSYFVSCSSVRAAVNTTGDSAAAAAAAARTAAAVIMPRCAAGSAACAVMRRSWNGVPLAKHET